MRSEFHITVRQTKNNLYLDLIGIFDGSSAWKLINTIHRKHTQKGQVFIDTDRVTEVEPFGTQVLDNNLKTPRKQKDRICFMGKHASSLLPEGCRLYNKAGEHQCRGNCRHCSCRLAN